MQGVLHRKTQCTSFAAGTRAGGHRLLRARGPAAAGVAGSSREPGERLQGCCPAGHGHRALPARPAASPRLSRSLREPGAQPAVHLRLV